jgi:hypothetical protein|tara:strand:+ start:47 stop:1030 length:984 start_codon:yes stop_codon:yes gene_type:complete
MIIDKFSDTLYIHIWEWLGLDEITETLKVNNISTLIYDVTLEFFLHYKNNDEIKQNQLFTEFVETNNVKVYFLFGTVSSPNKNIDKLLVLKNINAIYLPESFTANTLKCTETYTNNDDKELLFSSHNGRSRLHRCWMIDMLAKHKLLEIGNISWNELDSTNYRFRYWNEHIIKVEDKYNIETYNQFTIPDKKYMLSTFDLVTETSPDVIFYTEKTFKPMIRGKAFILFGAPGINTKLKEYGYRLFENVIDYSFDSIVNPIKRAEAIAVELKRLSTRTPNELHLDCVQDIEHNKWWVECRADKDHITPVVEKIAGNRIFTTLSTYQMH